MQTDGDPRKVCRYRCIMIDVSGTSAQPTWGVNSVWSNSNNWHEKMKAMIFCIKVTEIDSWYTRCFESKYFKTALKMTSRPMAHECGAVSIGFSAQARLHWTMHEDRATMKLWRFLRMPSLGCTNVSTRAGRSFRSPKLPARRSYSGRFWLRLCLIWGMINKLERLRVEDLWIDGAGFMFHAPWSNPCENPKSLFVLWDLPNLAQSCPIEGTVWRIRLDISVVCLLSLLTQYVLTDTALCWLVFCSFRSNQDVCLKWLESSCCFLQHSSSSLVERCWKNFMCRWELATPFDRDTFILQYGCNFPVAVSSGSLSFGLADGFYPLNVS